MIHINVNKKIKNAFEYDQNPATFSRGIIVGDMLYVSGTASIGENGETLFKDDFSKQLVTTYANLTYVLEEAGCNWNDVIRTTIYLRDIDRDYEKFNIGRKLFFNAMGIKNYPASTCIEAKLCRPDLLCEIELIAVKKNLESSRLDGKND